MYLIIEECNEFGPVETVFVDQTTNGDVWVKFANKDVEAAKKTIEILNGRLFAGRVVTAYFTSENMFKAKTGATGK